MFNFLKRFLNMDQALHVGQRAGLVREIAGGKGGYKQKSRKSGGFTKAPYDKKRWGTLGLSEVSTTIQKFHRTIVPRKERKALAEFFGTPFAAYTTGKSYHLLPHQVGKQLQKSNAYFAKINSKKWRKAAGER